jgi:hypothetical protein
MDDVPGMSHKCVLAVHVYMRDSVLPLFVIEIIVIPEISWHALHNRRLGWPANHFALGVRVHRFFLVLSLISISVHGEHIVSEKNTVLPDGSRRIEITESENRCVSLWLTTTEGPISYLFDTETKKAYFIPEIELNDFKLTGVQGDSEDGDVSRLDQYGEVTFRPTMTEKSKKDLALLKKEHANVENLFGKESFKIGTDIISDGKLKRADSDGEVNLRVTANGYSILKHLGKMDKPMLPSIQYISPCDGKILAAQNIETPEKLMLGFRGVHRQSSLYSPEVTKKLDELRRTRYGSKDPKVEKKTISDAVHLMLENPMPRDKALMTRFGMSRDRLARDLSDALVKKDVSGDPVGALMQDTGDLAWPIWQIEIYEKAVSTFFHDFEKNIHEVRHFIVSDPVERKKMESIDDASDERTAYGKKLIDQDKAIEVSGEEWGRLMHDNFHSWPNGARAVTKSVRTWDWDEDRNEKPSKLREKLDYRSAQ